MSDELAVAIRELQEKEALRLLQKVSAEGVEPALLSAQCRQGMLAAGQLYAEGTYHLAELIYAAHIYHQAIEILRAKLPAETSGTKVAVVVGTVAGDVHELGKSLVATLLEAAGYQVVDLGADVPPARFVEAVKQNQARVVGLSALMTTAFVQMKAVVDLLKQEGLRESVSVMLGGGMMEERVKQFAGADLQSRNAFDAVTFCDRLCGRD